MKNFKNLEEFYEFLTKVHQESRIFERELLKSMGELVESDAKRKFGEYQSMVGDYSAWAPLAEATMKDRVSKGFSPDDPLYRTGDLMNSIYNKVEIAARVVAVGSDDPIMLWQENGTPDAKHPIPPRPSLGPALFQNKAKIQKMASEMMFAWITGKALKPKTKL
jgi:hypothetical protein